MNMLHIDKHDQNEKKIKIYSISMHTFMYNNKK